ncbi:MAG TPA: hypothetical protein VHZ81_03625 [Galbitalea sp.]|jgi:hypothetical protein|nr:hypothetical protein [Galbitalea sp.]
MADSGRLDVLRFVDLPVERKSAWGPGEHASRQLEVNGQLLSDHLAAVTGKVVEQSTPIVEGRSGTVTPAAYLRALLGGPKDDVLAEGRIAIGYCDACLDGSCGTLLAANLAANDEFVTWSAIGFERFNEGEAPKLSPFWKRAPAEPASVAGPTWIPEPFEPDVTFRFARADYLQALQDERRRLGAHQ